MAGIQLIRVGEWSEWPHVADYRAAMLGDILVERLLWAGGESSLTQGGLIVGAPGYVWFRFWLPRYQQVVEKYFDDQGQVLGFQVDLCTPWEISARPWSAQDLIFDIWIDAGGQVTVRNELAFEEAAAAGVLSAEQICQAEAHLRRLTAATAQGRFPPALVRNWQVDLRQLKEGLAP